MVTSMCVRENSQGNGPKTSSHHRYHQTLVQIQWQNQDSHLSWSNFLLTLQGFYQINNRKGENVLH